LGIWHCMQESIIVNLDGNYDEWSFFARHWRTTEGRLKFLLTCGSVNDALKELFSCVAGISKWFVQRFRAANPDCDIIDYTRVDEFIDAEARQSKVFARLRSLLESTILTKVLHDSMRQGMLSNVRLLLRQLSELCAALNKFKYSRLLPQFEVLIATMPLEDLAFVVDVMFADLGSYFAPTDELTEVFNLLYWQLVGRYRSDRAWVKGIEKVSCLLSRTEPGRSLGTRTGSEREPSGIVEVDAFICASTRQALSRTFDQADSWRDQDGLRHSNSSSFSLAGTNIPPHADDIQRVGRALLAEDLRVIIFGGAAASAIQRNRPRTFHFSAERSSKASEKRRLQLGATLSSEIEKISYTKAEIFRDLNHYTEQTDIPSDVAAILSGPRSEAKHLIPSKSSSRGEMAMALAKWRRLAPEFCARAHLSQSNIEDPIDELVRQQPNTLERRTAARARLKSQGKVFGLHSKICERSSSTNPCSEDPAEELKKWLESHRNVATALKGEGARGFEAAHEHVTRSATSDLCSGNVRAMQRIVRLLKSSSELKKRGREAQMQAGRTFRRAAEIENLIKERLAKTKVVCDDSPWHDGNLEPPPASIGNAFAWRPVALATVEMSPSADLRQPSECRNTAAAEATEAGILGYLNENSRSRRIQMCSCCSQARMLGHVKICPHTNKTCSRCRKETP
jgi:hypothetical protein